MEAKVGLVCVTSFATVTFRSPLSTSEPCLPVSSFCLRDNNNPNCVPLAQTATNLIARNESEGSPRFSKRFPDTLPG